LQPTNQPINHTVSFSLLLGQTLAHLPSITRSKFPPQSPPLPSQNHHPRCHGKLLIKISIRREQKKQTQRIAATKSQPPSFNSCAIKLPKKPNTTKKQTPKSFHPQTPPPERRQKKVPKARELRVKKKKHKALPMQSKSNEKRDLQ
jgi:hypothetical protein